MTNRIGDKIKNLRKKADVTQEKLAEYLNITFQAISRWESGLCYPDLELLPAIANYFNVTTDELLGVDIINKKDRIEEVRRKVQLNFAKGLIDENIAICRAAVNEFPNEYGLLRDLAFYLGLREETKKESVSLYERILSDCTEEKFRFDAIQFLAYRYKEIGEKEKAIEIAKKLSDISTGTLLGQIYEGDELIKHLELELLHNCVLIERDLEIFACTRYNDNNDINCLRKRIAIYEKAVALYGIMLEDGDYGFYNYRMLRLYKGMAYDYLLLTDYDKTLNCLEKAAGYAIAFDTLPDVFEHTSLVFSDYKFKKATDMGKDHNSNNSYELLTYMSDMKLDIIRETPHFKDISANLEKYALKET